MKKKWSIGLLLISIGGLLSFHFVPPLIDQLTTNTKEQISIIGSLCSIAGFLFGILNIIQISLNNSDQLKIGKLESILYLCRKWKMRLQRTISKGIHGLKSGWKEVEITPKNITEMIIEVDFTSVSVKKDNFIAQLINEVINNKSCYIEKGHYDYSFTYCCSLRFDATSFFQGPTGSNNPGIRADLETELRHKYEHSGVQTLLFLKRAKSNGDHPLLWKVGKQLNWNIVCIREYLPWKIGEKEKIIIFDEILFDKEDTFLTRVIDRSINYFKAEVIDVLILFKVHKINIPPLIETLNIPYSTPITLNIDLREKESCEICQRGIDLIQPFFIK